MKANIEYLDGMNKGGVPLEGTFKDEIELCTKIEQTLNHGLIPLFIDYDIGPYSLL